MWVLKGVLVGFVIFIVGTLAYAVIRGGTAMYRLAQARWNMRGLILILQQAMRPCAGRLWGSCSAMVSVPEANRRVTSQLSTSCGFVTGSRPSLHVFPNAISTSSVTGDNVFHPLNCDVLAQNSPK